MKKIISFSLWGTNPKYVQGAYENLQLQKQFYNDWICRFYVDDSIPLGLKHSLTEAGAEVVEVLDSTQSLENYSTSGINPGWFWRFNVLNDTDVERFIVRDVDSRLSLREKNCVLDWERTKKPFHIIRDHRMHGVRVLAGTWGATSEFMQSINYTELLKNFLDNNKTNNPIYGGYDQFFLSTVIYPLIKNNVCIHDDYHFFIEEIVRSIPHFKTNNDFIGKPVEI